MDSPLSDNRSSNLLVYAVAVAAVISLVLGIVCLKQISNVKKQLGDVNIVDLQTSVTDANAKASSATTTATQANNAVRNLAASMEREITTQLADIRGNIQRVEDMAKQAMERPVASGGGGGGGGGPTVAPGTLGDDGTYVIKSGDTFGKIAPQFGVTVAEIVSANPGVDPRRLRVGQKIVIPKK